MVRVAAFTEEDAAMAFQMAYRVDSFQEAVTIQRFGGDFLSADLFFGNLTVSLDEKGNRFGQIGPVFLKGSTLIRADARSRL